MANPDMGSLETDDTLDTGAAGNPADGGNDLTDQAAADGVPAATSTETDGLNQLPGDGQPTITDPFATLKTSLGEIRVKGQPVEFRDIDHVKRLIQSGHGAAESANQYQALRQPYEWLNEQLADEGAQKLFAQFKEDPGMLKTYAQMHADPASNKLMQYFRHSPDFLKTVSNWIPEWEKSGQLDARILDLGKAKTETDLLRGRVDQFTQREQQTQAEQAENAEKVELHGMVNTTNNGIPFTAEQLGKVKFFRDGMRANGIQATYATALQELVAAGEWSAAKPSPGKVQERQAAAGMRGAPQATRQRVNPDLTDDEWNAKAKAAFNRLG